MAEKTIIESEMTFGPYDENHVFRIEESPQYTAINRDGVRCCEFLFERNRKILFVEAKKSCPNHDARKDSEDNSMRYNDYISEITEKMRHSLELYASVLLNRQSRDGISEAMLKTDLSGHELILILVVKKAEKEWLYPYVDVFKEKLRPEMKIWNIKSFLVINEETARAQGLVS